MIPTIKDYQKMLFINTVSKCRCKGCTSFLQRYHRICGTRKPRLIDRLLYKWTGIIVGRQDVVRFDIAEFRDHAYHVMKFKPDSLEARQYQEMARMGEK